MESENLPIHDQLTALSTFHNSSTPPLLRLWGFRLSIITFFIGTMSVTGITFAGPTVAPSAPVYAGTQVELQVRDAAPGSQVRVYSSQTGIGPGPCTGESCLDILPPVQLLGELVADANGSSSIVTTVPKSLSGLLYVQPVQLVPFSAGTVEPLRIWQRTSVLMIGDSITEGQQSSPAALPYTTMTEMILGRGFEVTQVGCGGATTWDWSSFGGTTLCGGSFWEPNVYTARALPNLPTDLVTVML
ncbi:hypothetical protein ACFL6N_07925, partial [Thermodesulfobacteriota bacterium]